jgi:hypothetical protein
MRWLLLTLLLLAGSAGLLGWVYLRDRDTHWQPSEPQLAYAAAEGTLSELGGAGCTVGCSAEALTRLAPHRWLARITVKGKTRCVQIDLLIFTIYGPHGLKGVTPHRCPHVARA